MVSEGDFRRHNNDNADISNKNKKQALWSEVLVCFCCCVFFTCSSFYSSSSLFSSFSVVLIYYVIASASELSSSTVVATTGSGKLQQATGTCLFLNRHAFSETVEQIFNTWNAFTSISCYISLLFFYYYYYSLFSSSCYHRIYL